MKQVEMTPDMTLTTILEQLKDGDVILTSQGHSVALVTDFDDDDAYWYATEHDPVFIESLAKAREHVAQGKVISHDELKKKLGL